MKILMIDSLVGNDYTFWLCRGLAEANHEVTLVTTADHRPDGDLPFKLLPVSPSKSKEHNKVLKLLRYFYWLGWLYIYILRTRPDIVHYQFFRRERIECVYFPLLRLISKTLIFTAHNILPHENTKLDYYLRTLVYKSAHKIIVHMPTIKEKLLANFKVSANKIAVVPAVKPIAGVRDTTMTKAMARDYLNIAPDAKILLFFGFIREYKGIDLLLEAFDIAKPSLDNLQLIVAGNPQPATLRDVYQTQIANMTYGASVTLRAEFIASQEVDYYFHAADALAMPYKRIDFSGIMQEAFVYALPVLATNVGNFADFITHGVNGYITDEHTPEAFAHIIKLAFDKATDLAQMGEAARKLDQAYPDWKRIGQLTLEVYQK